MNTLTLEQIEKRLQSQLGVVNDNDKFHYELLMNSWKVYLKAQAEIDKVGITLVCQNGRLFVNPACNVSNESWKQIVKLSESFGIKPIGRDTQIETDPDDVIAELL